MINIIVFLGHLLGKPGPLSPSFHMAPTALPARAAGLAPAGGRGGHHLAGHNFITCNCGQAFASLAILENHMARTHPDNTNIVSCLGREGAYSVSEPASSSDAFFAEEKGI